MRLGYKDSSLYKKLKRLSKQLRGKDLWMSPQVKRDRLRFGNWCVCPDGLSTESTVYSLGIGEDIVFDVGMIERFGVDIHAFDPTPNTVRWIKGVECSEKFRFFPWGVSGTDGTHRIFPRVGKDGRKSQSMFTVVDDTDGLEGIKVEMRRLSTIMKELGHTHIDVLKMDIESSEYEVIDEIVNANLPVTQILVEFHHHFEQIDKSVTKSAIDKLNKAGYRVFFISEKGKEYSFIRL